ncbi:hypothetical protein [Legionella bozemanae]|uniref:hypothetical protein n=1 Tax=Legionella bozemanae TaxID=447 RepID=UPI00399C504F
MFLNTNGLIALLGALAVFLTLAYRSFYFYDNTWDAIVYGLTRIDFYAHSHTLFINQPTQAINIFSSEWNGELNSLFYLLCVDNEQACSFGNVEIWLLSFLGYSWLSGIFGVPAHFRFFSGLLLASTPVILGLTTTVKGDLLASTCFAIGIGFTFRALSKEDSQNSALNLLFAYSSFGLAMGAKIIVLPFVCLTIFFLMAIFLSNKKSNWLIFLSGVFLFTIANSRYVLNYFDFEDFFNRLQSPAPSFNNIIGNLNVIIKSGSSISFLFSPPQQYYVLQYGLGFLAIPIALWFVYSLWLKGTHIYTRKKLHLQNHRYLVVIFFMIIGFSYLLINLPWRSWSFRYFTPYLLVLVTFIIAWPFHFKTSNYYRDRLLVICTIVIIMTNGIFTFLQAGEMFPVPYIVAKNQSEMERKLALHPYLLTNLNNLKEKSLEKIHDANILLFNGINSPALPFFGEKHQNNIELVDSLRAFKEKASTKKYHLAAITISPSPQIEEFTTVKLPGYSRIGSTSPDFRYWILFAPDEGNQTGRRVSL